MVWNYEYEVDQLACCLRSVVVNKADGVVSIDTGSYIINNRVRGKGSCADIDGAGAVSSCCIRDEKEDG